MICHGVETACGPLRLTALGGKGRPLVLIHGWGGCSGQWAGVVPGLAACHAVWAVDLPGRVGAPLTGPPSMAVLGQGIATGLAAADLRGTLVLGHSMGGPLMIEAALAAPDRVAGLLGLDTLADRIFYGGTAPDDIAARRQVFGADLAGETRRMIAAIAAPDTPGAVLDRIATDILAARPADLLDMRDALFAWRIGDRLPGIRVPLRLLNSKAVAQAHGCDPLPCLARVPQATYGLGHFPQIEAPGRLLSKLLVELDRLQQA